MERISDGFRSLTGDLRTHQLAWRPAPERWSIAQCLTHLTRTADLYLLEIDAAIARGREMDVSRRRRSREPLFTRFILRVVEPPVRLRVRAPRAFLPPPDPDLAGALPGFLASQERVIERMRRAEGLDLFGLRLRSPAIPLIRLSLRQAFAILGAHARRHMDQVRRVREDPAFPAP
jgi:hypothetical protein